MTRNNWQKYYKDYNKTFMVEHRSTWWTKDQKRNNNFSDVNGFLEILSALVITNLNYMYIYLLLSSKGCKCIFQEVGILQNNNHLKSPSCIVKPFNAFHKQSHFAGKHMNNDNKKANIIISEVTFALKNHVMHCINKP